MAAREQIQNKYIKRKNKPILWVKNKTKKWHLEGESSRERESGKSHYSGNEKNTENQLKVLKNNMKK